MSRDVTPAMNILEFSVCTASNVSRSQVLKIRSDTGKKSQPDRELADLQKDILKY